MRWPLLGLLLLFGVGIPYTNYLAENPPPVPFPESNGTYAHACCEKITLADGKLLVGGEWSGSYIVSWNKNGPYIHSKARVRVDRNGIDVNRYEEGNFISFIWYGERKEGTRPDGIQLMDGAGKRYLFKREGA